MTGYRHRKYAWAESAGPERTPNPCERPQLLPQGQELSLAAHGEGFRGAPELGFLHLRGCSGYSSHPSFTAAQKKSAETECTPNPCERPRMFPQGQEHSLAAHGEGFRGAPVKVMKTALAMMLSVLMIVSLLAPAAMAADEGTEVLSAEEIGTEPHTRPDGGQYRVAYIDYDEYLVASRQFYYILAGLEELGWIYPGRLPFHVGEIDRRGLTTKDMVSMLSKTDLGPYLAFDEDAFFYLGYDDAGAVAEALTSRAGKDIDLVITFGTSAGVFVKELGLPVPMFDFSATDPVASGIIDSATEGSGNPMVWAQVEPSPVFRQLKYYDSISPFQKLGVIIYGDETISGVPDIVFASEELGFQLCKDNIEEQPRETRQQLEDYYALVAERIQDMADRGIDAFYLTVDLINDLSLLRDLLKPFYDKGIPVYLMDDVEAVRNGGLMLISASDMINVGRFIAEAIAKTLNGAEAGSLPCVYSSAPGIYVNYSVAKAIDYPLNFEFLSICDSIFVEAN